MSARASPAMMATPRPTMTAAPLARAWARPASAPARANAAMGASPSMRARSVHRLRRGRLAMRYALWARVLANVNAMPAQALVVTDAISLQRGLGASGALRQQLNALKRTFVDSPGLTPSAPGTRTL